MIDSAGYSLPHPKDYIGYDSTMIPIIREQQLELSNVYKAKNSINSNRVTGYVQRSWFFRLKDTTEITFTTGIRSNYWTFNNDNIISPRASFSV